MLYNVLMVILIVAVGCAPSRVFSVSFATTWAVRAIGGQQEGLVVMVRFCSHGGIQIGRCRSNHVMEVLVLGCRLLTQLSVLHFTHGIKVT